MEEKTRADDVGMSVSAVNVCKGEVFTAADDASITNQESQMVDKPDSETTDDTRKKVKKIVKKSVKMVSTKWKTSRNNVFLG